MLRVSLGKLFDWKKLFGKILNLFPYSTLELDLFCVQNENNNANNVEYHIHNNVEFPPFWNILVILEPFVNLFSLFDINNEKKSK